LCLAAVRILLAMMSTDKETTNSSPVTVIVVRHGQTEWNLEGRWQGRLDSPLTALGREQAERVRELLADYPIDAAYSSDAGRAQATAAIILRGRGVDVVAHPAVRERDYGVYEGLTAAEIEVRYPRTRFHDVGGSRESWAPPSGETMSDVRERVRKFLLELAANHAGQTVLLATHSGIVRAVDSLCQGLSFDAIWHRVPQNGAIYIARIYPDGRFEHVWDNLPSGEAAGSQLATPAPSGQ
jgi:broad specificity phosphatase PhoE